jgi:6,7-dimethyl-8-ribityllumazine synthase
MTKGVQFTLLDGSSLRIGIVKALWNSAVTDALLDGCLRALKESGVREEHIVVRDVPGSYEVVYGAKHLIDMEKPDAVVCLGCLVKGETMHFEYIADAVTQGIMRLNLESGVPVIFGILTCRTEEQALARSRGENNHGYWWGKTAVEMALLKLH